MDHVCYNPDQEVHKVLYHVLAHMDNEVGDDEALHTWGVDHMEGTCRAPLGMADTQVVVDRIRSEDGAAVLHTLWVEDSFHVPRHLEAEAAANSTMKRQEKCQKKKQK